MAYDKTEMNGFVQDLYDKKMQEGKHGHYETMFHVVHQAIKRVAPPQRKPLSTEQVDKICAEWTDKNGNTGYSGRRQIVRAIEAAHGIKENT